MIGNVGQSPRFNPPHATFSGSAVGEGSIAIQQVHRLLGPDQGRQPVGRRPGSRLRRPEPRPGRRP